MRTEFINLMTAYLSGWNTIRDCVEWLASIDWDSPALDTESRESLGRAELLATEVIEGLRPEGDFWNNAAQLVERETNSIYVRQLFSTDFRVATCSNDVTTLPPVFTVSVGQGSQSWSILPVLVPA
ncbi:MAG: hypothetical protein FJ012_02555 [Chloroflexi bacterium]|nr:hypothetical protein [Chloroflexota bacterium]